MYDLVSELTAIQAQQKALGTALATALSHANSNVAPLPAPAPVPSPVPVPAPVTSRLVAGTYVANPNGSDAAAEAWFLARFQAHSALMGKPATMNAFTDFTKDPSTWPDNASWTAWSWMQSKAGLASVRPIVGVKLSDNGHWNGGGTGASNNDFYLATIAGTHDAAYAGVATAWVKAGFKDLEFRPGYEMDGSFMPDYQGTDAAVQQNWVKSFQRVSGLMKAAALAAGATRCQLIWNPADMNWTALSVAAAYPGDAYVDVVASDVYSPVYPGALFNFDAPTYSYAADIKAWFTRLENRKHYWTYPSANEWNLKGNGSGWGIRDGVALALAHKKSFAISECGQGADGTTTGLVDDPEFAPWLASELDLARSQGVVVDHVNIWSSNESDGHWGFAAADNKPLAAAAWAKAFGTAA